MEKHTRGYSFVLCLCMIGATWASNASVTLLMNQPAKTISPTMHGIFFEDINYSADGGLYAELVQNRSFEHKDHLYGWTELNWNAKGKIKIATEDPMNDHNPTYLRMTVEQLGNGFGISNKGFGGISVRGGEKYRLSVHVRSRTGFAGNLCVDLSDIAGNIIGQCAMSNITTQWTRLEKMITVNTTRQSAILTLVLDKPGQIELDMVSLFPENTFNRRRNGVRKDLAEMLVKMKPRFLRFPGGCIVEGKDLANAYRWKDTIGDIAERKQNWNRWQTAMKDRPAPQYYQTYGLGFFEYFQLAEDLDAEPIPIINCGMSCQYQDKELVPLDELNPWVQDALDLIEFANGPQSSTWGAKRAAMGHPKPFNMAYLGVGNEQWDEVYFERYQVFYEAIKAKYPDITIITTSGPGVDDEWWTLAWDKFKNKTMPAEIVDEHYYRPPQWFLDQNKRYDSYDRQGPKVFAGEFAAHQPNRRSTLNCALTEAAFMTGLQRNADIVVMSAFAPLFGKLGSTQWTPDLIFFDNTRVFGTPSYYVQQLFSVYCGDRVYPVILSDTRHDAQGLYAVATQDELSGDIYLKLVNIYNDLALVKVQLLGVQHIAPQAKVIVLTSRNLQDENSLYAPNRVIPREKTLDDAGLKFDFKAVPYSVNVLCLKTK